MMLHTLQVSNNCKEDNMSNRVYKQYLLWKLKTNMTMAYPPFEDVFPIEFSNVMLVFGGVRCSTGQDS